MLELALLGLLREAPVHGYELRKQLALRLGGLRAYSYGSLYPALRRLTRAGLIVEESGPRAKRARKVYRITAEGKERLDELLAEAGPHAWDDEGFGIHLAFFGEHPDRNAHADPRRPSPGRRGAAGGHAFRAGQGGRTDRPIHQTAAAARARRM